MEEMYSYNSEEAKDENSSKLLGKKLIFFSVERDSENSKKSYSGKYSRENLSEGRWSYIEQIQFIDGLSKNGPNWKKIKETMNTRSLPQIRSHAQKFFKKLKRCKNEKLGIDFTSSSIRSIKDMIRHIKSVNSDYDINNIFLFFCDNQPKNPEGIKRNDFYKNNANINISNVNPQIINKDNNINTNTNTNNNLDLNNLNNILLMHSLNNIQNTLNAFILNYLNKSIIINDLINRLSNDLKQILSDVGNFPTVNNPNSSNDINLNEIIRNGNDNNYL